MDILPKGTNKNTINPATEEKKPLFKIPDLTAKGGKFSFGQKISALEGRTSETKLPLVLSLVVLFLVGIIWFGLIFYKNSLNKNIESTKQQIESLSAQENKEMQTKIIDLERNLKDVKNLLTRHIYSSKIFDLLEKMTLPQVQWTELNLKIESDLLSLKGRTNSYSNLAKQILIFEQEQQIKEVKSSSISLAQLGGIGFNMEINLNSEVFTK